MKENRLRARTASIPMARRSARAAVSRRARSATSRRCSRTTSAAGRWRSTRCSSRCSISPARRKCRRPRSRRSCRSSCTKPRARVSTRIRIARRMGKLKPVKATVAPPASLEAALELIERLPVPMYVKGRDGKYLGVNRAWEELFGLKRASFLGKTVADLYPRNPEIAEQHARKDRELWEHPGSQSYEIPIVTPGGRRRDTIYCKATFPGGLVGAIFDVTAQKTAEKLLRESEERWRATVDSASEGMLVYDRDLVIVSANRAAERIVGLPVSEMVGKAGFTSLLPCIREDGTPLTQEERPTRVTVRTGQPQTGRIVGIKRADGAVTWLSVNTAFLRREDETGYYGLVST